MKILLPPIITIFLAIAFDQAVDLIFGLGPYDESGTPGIIFFIELLMMVSIIIFILTVDVFILQLIKKYVG